MGRCQDLSRFLDDGCVELDFNVAERTTRPLALICKNALFSNSNAGGQHWVVLVLLVQTCKLHGVGPQAYLADALTRLTNHQSNSRLNKLLQWFYGA